MNGEPLTPGLRHALRAIRDRVPGVGSFAASQLAERGLVEKGLGTSLVLTNAGHAALEQRAPLRTVEP